MTDIQAALARGRAACLEHMRSCEAAGLQWTEEPVTEILLSRSAPEISFATFTRGEEAKVGADWLWWWVAPTGESFGMLIQAKRLYIKGSKWSFKFNHNSGEQQRALFEAARALDVAPVYSLYLGSQSFRSPATCSSKSHMADNCQVCTSLTVSLLPANLAVSHLTTDAESVYERSVALETGFDNAETQSAWLGAIDATLTDDLRDFLTAPQDGVRAIARSLVDRVLQVRQGQFSKGVDQLIQSENLGTVFSTLPGDIGHFNAPYLPQMLRGLLLAPPDYVVAMMTGEPLGHSPAPNVAGVILARLAV